MAFDPVSGKSLGALQDGTVDAIHISGLWGLPIQVTVTAEPTAMP